MVLEEVDQTSPDAVSDSFQYQPDDQPQDTGNGNRLPLWTVETVRSLAANSTLYPNPFRPVPVYAKLLGWSDDSRDRTVVNYVNRTQFFVDRRLTQTEVEAETYYQSNLCATLYKSEAIGLFSFLALAAVRQNAGRPGLITPYARRFLGPTVGDWFIALSRFGVYGFFGRLQGSIIGAMVGINRMNESMRRDPNVHQLRVDLAEFRQWSENEVRRKVHQRRMGGPKESIFPTADEIRSRHGNRPHPSSQSQSMDPFASDSISQDTSSIDSLSTSIPTTPSTVPESPPKVLSRSPAKTPQSTTSSDSDDLFSSIIPEPNTTTTGTPTPANESAWERLRRQRQAEHQRGQAPSQSGFRPGASRLDEAARMPKSDSFAFSETDEERQLAKSEAQRDFDARVERERRGEQGWGSGIGTSSGSRGV
ncbi:hypothetical protein BDZ91DRAFT_711321 [Kalaharituber pfeilii]|nr:hypothetical protein BDZ91DRAFT_711321 [Kalaharituber pfeilii]